MRKPDLQSLFFLPYHERIGEEPFAPGHGVTSIWSRMGRSQLQGCLSRYVAMGFFDSEIVQQEAKELFEDYQSLVQLGGKYGKFDAEGKKIFIERMESVMERYRIFMKRFELSEDFSAQVAVEQLKTHLGQLGITPQQMFAQMNATLERMKAQIGE